MPAEYELAAKVETMRQLAKENYRLYLGAIGLKLEGNRVVNDPQNRAAVDPVRTLEQEQQRWTNFHSDLGSLCNRIEKFYPLDPLDLTIIGGRLGGMPRDGVVVENLAPTNASGCIGFADSNWMSRVDGMIAEDQWSGDAAEAFHSQFLFPFHTAAQQQRFYLRELHIAMRAYHDAVTRGIDDMNKILDSGNATLAGNHDGTSGDAFFTVVGILSAVVALFGGPLGLFAGGVGLATALYSGIASEASHPNDGLRPELRVYGANAPQNIESIWDAVVTLEGFIADVDDQLDRGLNKDLDSASGFASPSLKLDRPELADFDKPDDLGQLQVASVAGVPMSENLVVASIVDLYEAGYVNLPGAAYEYAQAAALLDACTLPGYLTWFFQRSPLRYEESRLRLAAILGSTQRSLTDCGAALVEVATQYCTTDEESAEMFRRIGDLDPPAPRTVQTGTRTGMS